MNLRLSQLRLLQTGLHKFSLTNLTTCETMLFPHCPSSWNTSRMWFFTSSWSTFEYMWMSRYAYMIDNVVLLITGTLHERDTHELLERCHPLGVFDTMPALCVATNVEELYQSVLVETPLGMLPWCIYHKMLTFSFDSSILPWLLVCDWPWRP